MAKKNKEVFKTVPMNDVLMFPEDFAKIPKECLIFIDKGTILLPKKNRRKTKWPTRPKVQKKKDA